MATVPVHRRPDLTPRLVLVDGDIPLPDREAYRTFVRAHPAFADAPRSSGRH